MESNLLSKNYQVTASKSGATSAIAQLPDVRAHALSRRSASSRSQLIPCQTAAQNRSEE
jgi:hypothetical protein